MSFITESKKAYKQVRENHVAIAMGNMLDDEGSMILNQLEELERGIEMLRAYVGNDYEKQLPAWVQSKVTLATDYISTVGNYLSSKNEKVTEETIKESSDLTETTFEKIYQMQQDGKSSEDIAKELKLNPALVKKVLGEQIELKEFTDAQIAQLKKEYDPLKGKTITTSQYQQLKNILFKLKDGDLEKLQKQNIPFASTGAGSILRVRKSPVKITSVKVPGLEGMAEEKIPQGYLDYLRTIVYKKVDFYEIPPKHIIQHWRDEKNKDRFTGKIIDYKEENQYAAVHVKKGETSVTANSSYEAAKKASEKFGLKNTAGVTVYLTKKDGKEIIHKATEEVEIQEATPLQTSITMMKTLAAAAGIKPATSNNGYQAIYDYKNGEGAFKGQGKKSYEQVKSWIYKNGYVVQVSYLKQIMGEEVEIQEEPKLNQKDLDKFHTSLDKLVHKTFGSSSDEKKKEEPKKEAYKGAKATVEKAFKKLKEKK